MPRRVGDFRGLTQPNRLRLLREIQRVPGRRAAELAEECGLPPNTVRDHLRVLEREGLIRGETLSTHTRGRPPVVFHPVTEPVAGDAAAKRIQAAKQHGAMLRAATGVQDAALDDAALTQIDVLYEHLDDAGLDPVVDESTLTFEIAPCRYHGLIDKDQALVCAVHARLVSDVLRQTGGPLALQRVEPFVGAHCCRVLLTQGAGTPLEDAVAAPGVPVASGA